jgi:hypothetical protein
MKTITHEGKEYILKSEVDGIIQSRLSKITESKRQSEQRVTDLESQITNMTSSMKGVDALNSRVQELESALKSSNDKYTRHNAITQAGITNPQVRDLVEWQYNKTMESLAKKDRVPLSDWLSGMKESGQVPLLLEPYLNNANVQTPTPSPSLPQADTHAQMASIAQPAQPPGQPAQPSQPTTNAGVQPTTDSNTSQSMMQRAVDFDYYMANRKKIKAEYYKKRGRTWQK